MPGPRPPFPVRRITDPRELRALAHPVRMALLEMLVSGPLTATQCAERLGESPASCSYHLRQLARYGHVRPAEGGKGRERPWQLRDTGIEWDEDDPSPARAAAGRALAEMLDEQRFDSWRRFRSRRDQEPADWRRAVVSTDIAAWMTSDELAEVTQRVYDAWAPYADRQAAGAERPMGARSVRFFAYAYPGDTPDPDLEAGAREVDHG
jgi:predicted ArsR family transcriptional regulator